MAAAVGENSRSRFEEDDDDGGGVKRCE